MKGRPQTGVYFYFVDSSIREHRRRLSVLSEDRKPSSSKISIRYFATFIVTDGYSLGFTDRLKLIPK